MSKVLKLHHKTQLENGDSTKPIAEAQIGFFGGRGIMLLPSVATIANLLRQIPPQHLLTTEQLRSALATQYGLQGTCPVTTRKALQTIATQADSSIPYWRVINASGGLNSRLPDQAQRLEAEGLMVIGEKPKVSDWKKHLVGWEIL